MPDLFGKNIYEGENLFSRMSFIKLLNAGGGSGEV
jgi:hypothetical protein